MMKKHLSILSIFTLLLISCKKFALDEFHIKASAEFQISGNGFDNQIITINNDDEKMLEFNGATFFIDSITTIIRKYDFFLTKNPNNIAIKKSINVHFTQDTSFIDLASKNIVFSIELPINGKVQKLKAISGVMEVIDKTLLYNMQNCTQTKVVGFDGDFGEIDSCISLKKGYGTLNIYSTFKGEFKDSLTNNIYLIKNGNLSSKIFYQ